MQTQQINSPQIKTTPKLIDLQKIKSILSKKIENKVTNPEELLKQMEEQLAHQVSKTESYVSREMMRQQKIKKVEHQSLRSRSNLKDQILSKIEKSSKNRIAGQKKNLQTKIQARKIKEQFFEERKKQMKQTQFKDRLEKFKTYRAQNVLAHQDQNQISNKSLLHNRSVSLTNLNDHRLKSRQVQQVRYHQKLEKISKRRIYEKPTISFKTVESLDKTQAIHKIEDEHRNTMIQKLGNDLTRIQQARKNKATSIKMKLQSTKKQKQIHQQQRMFKVQSVKQNNLRILMARKQSLNKKNQRLVTFQNKSASLLQRNWSEKIDKSKTGVIQERVNFSKTVSSIKFNFNSSIKQQKDEEYLRKQKDRKTKRQVVGIIENILKEQKVQLLIK